ncbi:MAG TPA: flagellar hook-basal body complex protein FliE [Bryobacterales bacterium]|nr:flagellar hook-basal body complex protein FliE [Bryobacterales bacterium]
MPGPVSSVGITPPLVAAERAAQAGGAENAGAAFGKVLAQAIARVEQYRAEADTAVNQFLAGEREDLHNVALATQRAELAFELFLQARNKVVQAYQEIMRMQV